MPRSAGADTLVRHWTLLKLLPARGPGKTVRELTEALVGRDFPVTRRTIERDLQLLSGVFPLVCNDKGTPQGWHWHPGHEPALPELSLADAVSMQTIETLLRPLLPKAVTDALEGRFGHARRRLQTEGGARWRERLRYVAPALPVHPPVIAAGVLEAVQEAVLGASRSTTVVPTAGRGSRCRSTRSGSCSAAPSPTWWPRPTTTTTCASTPCIASGKRW